MSLASIKYFPLLNQSSIVDDRIISRELALEKMIKLFRTYVRRVYTPDPNADIHMGISFTNTMVHLSYVGKKWRMTNFSFMFWPEYGEVEYEFNKGNFT